MTKEEKKVDFNLSVLELKDLIKVYNEVDNFIKYMKDKKIVIEEKEKNE